MRDIEKKMRQVARTDAVLREELGRDYDRARRLEEQSRQQKKRLQIQRRLFRRRRELLVNGQ